MSFCTTSAQEIAPLDTLAITSDRLGLLAEPLYVAREPTEAGEVFTVVHSRPLASGPMATYLNNIGPLPSRADRSTVRAGYNHHLIRRDTAGDTKELADHIIALHSRLGKAGIGGAFMDFEAEVQDPWVDLLADETTDSVYETLRTIQVYKDFSATAKAHIETWKAKTATMPQWHGAEKIAKLLLEFAPSDDLMRIRENYGNELSGGYQQHRDKGGDSSKAAIQTAYERYGQSIARYLSALPTTEKEELIGNALSQYESAGLGGYALNGLVVDLKAQRSWYRQRIKYDLSRIDATTDMFVPLGFYFNAPTISYLGESALGLSDAETGVAVQLQFGENDDASTPLPWKIAGQKLPTALVASSRHAAVSWRTDATGTRTFLSHAETMEAARRNQIPVQGSPDSYLGKLFVWYMRQAGEYQPNKGQRMWQTEMGLPGSPSKRNIGARELPVWIQLPQHQPDLLSSGFIAGVERLAA